jgi:hypothetical protein
MLLLQGLERREHGVGGEDTFDHGAKHSANRPAKPPLIHSVDF